MWSTLPSSRWVFLLSLAAALLFSASDGQSFIRLPCCRNLFNKTAVKITKCYEQRPRWKCKIHAYILKTQNGRGVCINPDSAWIKEKLAKGLKCSPDITLKK
ncbi:regakine-1-like [Kryptolebias marmoratus]|uniref:regakine-1-like n=1 Tax=Kryptolebias marmoratus TaxID=37003 RepID=UPI000D530F5D|nr:regakine-1-like [Kryptolebias marmoratus]